MKIILVLLGMLITCGLFGAILIFVFRANEKLKKLILHIGYAYTLVAFHSIYLQVNSAFTATLFTVAFPLILAIVILLARSLTLRFIRRKVAVQPANASEAKPISTVSRNEFIYPVVVSIIVVLLAVWPYLLLGWGNYWHSGSEDIEDALNGRDVYVNDLMSDTPSITIGEIFGIASWTYLGKATAPLLKREERVRQYLGEEERARELKNLPAAKWTDFLRPAKKVPISESRRTTAEEHRLAFAVNAHPYQYSSLAFWSMLFDERHGMDMFIVQALLDLILMAVGVFFLCRYAFSMTLMVSAFASAISAGSSFYMISYWAGHEGSLIYEALIPSLLLLALTKDNGRHAITCKLILGGLIAVAVFFSYPYPLPLLVAPLSVYLLSTLEIVRNRVSPIQSAIKSHPIISYIGVIVLAITIFFALNELWHLTAFSRTRMEGYYRTWGYTHDSVIIPIFLGLIPSPGQGDLFIGNLIGKSAYFGLILVSCLFAVIMLVLYFKARPSTNSDFFQIYGCFWIIGYYIFNYIITDSYYIYKYLYIHQFILVIGIVSYVAQVQSRSIKLLCVGILMTNVASDLAWGNSLFRRPYNKSTEALQTSITQLDRALLAKSFIDLRAFQVISVRQTLKANGIQTVVEPSNADYFIVQSGSEADITGSQLTETVGAIAGYDIKRAPAKNCLWISTYNEPERFPADPVLKDTVFRWVGHRKINNLNVIVFRPSAPEEMKGRYLRACFQKGPSAEEGINISVSAGKEVFSKFRLEGGGVHCEWIPAERVVSATQVVIKTGAIGESLLPYDDRILMYRAFAVGWTDRIYDDRVISFFNATPDIIRNGSKKAKEGSTPDVTIKLGQGWEAYESLGGLNFRWAGRSTELVLTGDDKDGVANVAVELEPGPSHGRKILELEVWDRAGNLVFTSPPITGRNSVMLPLGYRKQQTSVYVLKTRSLNLPVPGDSRILDYRVFSIALQ